LFKEHSLDTKKATMKAVQTRSEKPLEIDVIKGNHKETIQLKQ